MITNYCKHIYEYSPLVDIRRKRESQYILNGYITSRRQTGIIHGKEYSFIYYQGDHQQEYLVYPNNHTGVVRLFKNGVVSLEWEIKNGKRVGYLVLFENGCAVMKESWDSIFGDDNCYCFIFTEDGMQLAIEDKYSHQVIYTGNYNPEMQRDGRGIEYDAKSGKELFEGIWKNDRLQRILKVFEDNRMVELNESSQTTDVSDWKPTYMGSYFYDEEKLLFLRHGRGCTIDPESGMADSKGEWDMGEEVWSTPLLDGMTLHQAVISDETDLKQVSPLAEELVTLSHCCIKMSELNFSMFSELRSISLGNRCFENIQTFVLNRMNHLRRLKIGKCCFTPFTERTNLSQSASFASSFQVTNCPVLRRIEIGAFSFRDYSGGFELLNLPHLEELKIGVLHKESSNFLNSDFILHGNQPIIHIKLIDLPKLRCICLGSRSFCNVKQVKMISKRFLLHFLLRFTFVTYSTAWPIRLTRRPLQCNVRK